MRDAVAIRGPKAANTRSKRLLTAFVLAASLVLASAGPASAQEKPTEQETCIIEEARKGHDVKHCTESHNALLPEVGELIWGTLAFIVLVAALAKFAYPAVKKGLANRADKIKSSLDDAEATRVEAQNILEEYRTQLADAKNESARIIEEARQAADKLRQDLKRQAEAEVADVKARAQEDIAAQLDRARADLQSQVAALSVDLAEKVVERSLDRQTNLALIENFIRETEAAT